MPLHYAADGGPAFRSWNPEAQAEMIALLIENGADPNALDKSGVAPLHRAVRQRCTKAVDALLRNGADVRLKNKSGSTPLHLAVQNTGRGGTGSPEAKTCQKEIIELLLKAGAKLQDRDARGKTAKQCAQSDWIRALF
jgi:ankyrin repeat protein